MINLFAGSEPNHSTTNVKVLRFLETTRFNLLVAETEMILEAQRPFTLYNAERLRPFEPLHEKDPTLC